MTIEASSITIGPSVTDRSERYREQAPSGADIVLDLTGAIIAIRNGEPVVLALDGEDRPGASADALPSGSLIPGAHASLEAGIRECVRNRTGLELGYVEQLCTFGDQGPVADVEEPRLVSVGYLALMLGTDRPPHAICSWRRVYDYFPWEDWRSNRPSVLVADIEPRLRAWAEARAASESPVQDQRERLTIAFGLDGARWDDERVLERYELMTEAGLVHEAHTRRDPRLGRQPTNSFGRPMANNHRRVLAAALGRLRAKIRYRPVVFELMDSEFTLFDLQKTVEAILGPHLHKQNFRRLVESVGLVEPTGDIRTHTGGRPAKLYRFRREVLLERPAPGVRIKAVARG